MEAECTALSSTMRDLIPLWTLVDEIKEFVGGKELLCCMYSLVMIFEDNYGALILASSPRMTPHSKHIMIKYHVFKQTSKTTMEQCRL